jgi:SAM-dependent methyltransferase
MTIKARFAERPEGAATMSPDMPSAAHYYAWTAEQFESVLGDNILDIGGGFGSHLDWIVRKGRCVFSIDLAETSVQFMRERFAAFPKFDAQPMEFGSSTDQSELIARRFDTITCMNVLEHIDDDLSALRHMHAILVAQHGTLCLQVPAHPWLYGSMDLLAGHYRRYSAGYLRSVLTSAGFAVKKLYHFNTFGVLPWYINAVVLRKALDDGTVGLQLRLFDRYFVPVLRVVERRIHFPVGQSLIAVVTAESQ